MLTDAEARAAVASLSWVARSPQNWGHRCTALITRAPREAIWTKENSLRQDLPEAWRCRKTANWVIFDTEGRIRTLCWHHLWVRLRKPGPELERFTKAAEKWDLLTYRPDLDPSETNSKDLDPPS